MAEEENDEGYSRKDYLEYNEVERGSESKYPGWVDSKPNLQTYLDAFNLSQPIVQCQYELVWSRWPRTIFFAKNVTIPGISVNTLDLSHAGFTISIPTHVTYENTDITFNIIADKEGFHYYDLRNMVLQSGHPLVAGDPRATIGNQYNLSPDEDILEIRLRNKPEDGTHHHWIIHNFHPTKIGDIELTQDGSSFVEFELTGTFTHISYDCGKAEDQAAQDYAKEEGAKQPTEDEEPYDPDDWEDDDYEDDEDEEDYDDPYDDDYDEDYDYYDDDEYPWDDEDDYDDDEYPWDEDEDWDEEDLDEYDDEYDDEDEDEEDDEEDDEEEEEEEEEPPTEADIEAEYDDDEKLAASYLKNPTYGKNENWVKKKLENEFKQKYPGEDPDLIETRVDAAIYEGKKYNEAKEKLQQQAQQDFEDKF